MNSESPARAFRPRGAALVAIVCVCLAICGLLWYETGGAAPGGPPGSIRATDAQNGASITLHPGQTLIVTLSSTYWSFQGSSNPQALVSVGSPVVSPAPFYQNPVPGSGAGTVTAQFRAVGLGTAQVTASRVSCGEAMRCGDASGQYQLTVQVRAATP